MIDSTEQYRLPPFVSVRHVPHSGYYLEDERGRWFALVRHEWQIPLAFELWAGVVVGLHAAVTTGGTNK